MNRVLRAFLFMITRHDPGFGTLPVQRLIPQEPSPLEGSGFFREDHSLP